MSTNSSGSTTSKCLLYLSVAASIATVIGSIIAYLAYVKPSSPPSPTPPPSISVTTPTPTPTDTPTPTTVIQSSNGSTPTLNQSYTGTTRGFANGSITFSLISEDQQGNVSLGVTFTTSDNKQANYNCQGAVTNDRQITLQCSEIDAQNFLLDIKGVIFQDGHMEGTMVATNSSDASYHHNYTWNAS
jgi:hypothetical protein